MDHGNNITRYRFAARMDACVEIVTEYPPNDAFDLRRVYEQVGLARAAR